MRFLILAFALLVTMQTAGAVEFATEPVAIPDGTIEGQSSVIVPTARSSGPIHPDLPLEAALELPLSVKFLFEHRSALNGRQVTVQGKVVSALLGEDACPSQPPADKSQTMKLRPMMCAQPRVVITDETGSVYNLTVLLPEDDQGSYEVSQTYSFTGLVSSSSDGVVLRK